MAYYGGICTSSYPFPYSIQKVGDSPYSYSYPVNTEIPYQNGDKFNNIHENRFICHL